MAKKRVVTPRGESWVDDTPAPTPAPVQKFTPIDVQTKAQDAIAPKYTQNLLNVQEQQAQKAPAPVAQQPQQTTPVVSPVSQQETQPSTVAQNTQTTPQQPLPFQSSPQQNIPQKSAMPPAYQDKVGIPTLPGQQAPQQSTAAPISDNFYDPSNFMYTGMSKEQYDLLDPQNKIQALQTGENFLKQRQGVQGQAEKFAEYTRQKEYLTQQNEIKGQMTGLQEQNTKIQSEQQLRSSQQALNNLEQNLGFLGSQGKPAVFKQAMEAMKFQMFDAQRLHSELVTMQENGQKLRDLGIEFDENQFNKQMQDMEMAMNDQVDRSIQQALQGFNSQMMLGEIDTPAKLNALTNKWLDSIDMDVTNITNRQMGMIGNMINQYKTLADEAKTRLAEDAKKKEQAQNVNEAMSKVRGYYVDGNGQIIVGNDGKPVYLPEKAPMEPVFKDGYLITFSTDANGQIVAKPQKVMEQSDMDKINLALKGEELRAKQLENAKLSGTSTTGGSNAADLVKTNPQSIVNFSVNNRDGRTNLQCGELVNDYLFKATGKDPSGANRLGDTYQSKVKAIDNLGRANGPVEGGVFAFKTGMKDKNGNDIGHTGIVQSVNPDGSINVLEANSEGSKNGSAPVTRTYKDVSKMVFSQPPVTQQTSIKDPTPAELAMFEKGAQYIGKKGGLSQDRYNQIAEYQKTAGQDILNTYEPTFKNESQSKSFEYANRMIPSLGTLNNLEDTWLDKDAYYKLSTNELAPNVLQSSEYQQYDQAKRDFLTAVLRKESGATISDSEFAGGNKQYFVQPGDKKEVIAQKKANREQALKGFMQTSGPGNGKYLEAVKGQYVVPTQNSKAETKVAANKMIGGPTPYKAPNFTDGETLLPPKPITAQLNGMTPEQILQQYVK